eukprot:c15408_g1_i1 orf=96-353(+)
MLNCFTDMSPSTSITSIIMRFSVFLSLVSTKLGGSVLVLMVLIVKAQKRVDAYTSRQFHNCWNLGHSIYACCSFSTLAAIARAKS